MNTRQVIRKLEIWGGGIVLLTVSALVFTVTKRIQHRKKYKRNYDPDTVEEIKGEIVEVGYTNVKNDETSGAYINIQVEEKILSVHLGPSWYIKRQKKQFKIGDRVTVTGSKVNRKGDQIIIAAVIKRGNSTFYLRDEKGMPRWRGWQ